MRLHTDTLTATDVYQAARTAGATVEYLARKGSRSRDHAFEIALSGSSSYRSGHNMADREPAATYDEWGIFLGVLFDRDPRMIAGGPNGYVGAVDYAWQTGSRFERGGPEVEGPSDPGGPRVLTPAEQHKRHTWNYHQGGPFTGLYAIHACRCGAVRRFLIGCATHEDLGLNMPERTSTHA